MQPLKSITAEAEEPPSARQGFGAFPRPIYIVRRLVGSVAIQFILYTVFTVRLPAPVHQESDCSSRRFAPNFDCVSPYSIITPNKGVVLTSWDLVSRTNMASHELRNQIRSLRRNCATPEGSFIPQRLLYRLLTRAIISVALRQAGISALQIDDLAIKIYKGGQKVFAILVLLKGEESKIANFITHDQFAQSQLDFKLPFSLELLNTIIPDIADEFFETQWEFVAPVFSRGVIHRELHDRTKLPFLQNTEIGSGGFGDVYEIQLDPDHQTMAFAPKEDVSSQSPEHL